MIKKQTLTILCGGQSPEHHISLTSAFNIANVARANFLIILIGIDQSGNWYLLDPFSPFINQDHPTKISLNFSKAIPINLVKKAGKTVLLTEAGEVLTSDIYFPVLHGENGEDGSIQGMLQLLDVPYVGCGISASANGMDKDLTKRLLREAGIAVTPGICLENGDSINIPKIIEQLELPLFIKPARLGSSVGITKVKHLNELESAIKQAFTYDTKILIEQNIVGREIECAVLGNHCPISSLPGEIIPETDYYSFETKYLDSKAAVLKCPAELSQEEITKFQTLACKTYKTLGCAGMTRVDFFYTEDKKILVNEVNTIPGFTKISMYPNLWEKTGISTQNLIQKLVDFAIEAYKERKNLKREQSN